MEVLCLGIAEEQAQRQIFQFGKLQACERKSKLEFREPNYLAAEPVMEDPKIFSFPNRPETTLAKMKAAPPEPKSVEWQFRVLRFAKKLQKTEIGFSPNLRLAGRKPKKMLLGSV